MKLIVVWTELAHCMHSQVLIYAREGVTEEQLVKEAKDRFNVNIEQPFQVRDAS